MNKDEAVKKKQEDACQCEHEHCHEKHEHEHKHGTDCGCSHERHESQKHHQSHGEDCSCTHNHHAEEEHHHEHGEDCGCGHDHHEGEGHHHEQSEGCGCTHDHHTGEEHHHEHSENCSCGHGHHEKEGHHHEHGEDCGCGHNHHTGEGHHHEHGENCDCGHDHHKEHAEAPKCNKCGKHLEDCNCDLEGGKYKKEIFILENLGCANCAAKMEEKIKKLPEVHSAAIIFTTKQLRVTGENPKELLSKFQEICSSIESEVVVKIRDKQQEAEERKDEKEQEKKELFSILLGAAVFGVGLVIEEKFGMASIILMAISYLILGGEIVVTAVKNLLKGKVFDENFLMTIATLGAFGIQEYPEAVGVMLFYRIGEFFEHKAVAKSRSQIMQTIDMRAENVTLITGDATKIIPAIEAKVGDVILIKPGERIPLDGVITGGETRIDTSPVTGEPVPVGAKAGDFIISGCVNVSGVIKMKVEKVLEESMVSRIMESVENAAASKPKIDRFITKFARVYTPFVVIVAAATAVIPSLITGNWEHWIYTALTFLVISCPCALVLSVPLAFFSGIGAGSKQGILFKGGLSLEAMKDVKAVVMDKTGTITEGNFVLQRIVPVENVKEAELLSLACACEENSTHPIAVSIVNAAREQKIPEKKASQVTEITGHGIEAVIDGKKILCGNRKLMDLKGIDCQAYKNQNYGTEVLVASEGKFIGYLVISDTIKKDAKSAIHAMNKQGIVTVMLTGDTEENAKAVAEATGVSKIYAKLLPEDKVSRLQDIRKEYGNVMFVGDGINDAPVLAGADVGAAMGSGADAAIEAADVVFMTSNMEAVPESLKIAKVTGRIAMENVVFALVIKALVMVLGLVGIASMWLAVFADSGVAVLCVLNSIRVLYKKKK